MKTKILLLVAVAPMFVDARFLTVDPKREFVNPYNYVGNNPVIAIDPNGEEVFFMQGTSLTAEQFHGTRKHIAKALKDVPSSYKFPQKLSLFDRKKAARHLFKAIKSFHEANPGKPINLVGQSHGGNVFLNKTFIKQVNNYNTAHPDSQISFDNVILLNTPIRDNLLPDYGLMKKVVLVSVGNDPWQKAGGMPPFTGKARLPEHDQATNIFVKRDVFDAWYMSVYKETPSGTQAHQESAFRTIFWERFVAPILNKQEKK